MPYLDVDGDKVHFVENRAGASSAPTLLFVHGSCGVGRQWKRLADALAPEFQSVVIDLPGTGESERYPISRKWTMEVDERAITALIGHLDRPFHFVGHSAGCVISWRALQACSDVVLSYCLFEPVFFGLLRNASNPQFKFVENLRAEIIKHGELGNLEEIMTFFVDQWAGTQGLWASMPENVRKSMRPGAGRLYHECKEFPEFEDRPLAPPTAPVLLVEGKDSHPAMHAIHDLLEDRWPGIVRVRIPSAGHMVPFTHSTAVAPLIREHVMNCHSEP